VGLWNRARDRRMADPVAGILELAGFTVQRSNSSGGRVHVDGIVRAPGLPPTVIRHTIVAPGDWQPDVRRQVPVVVDRADTSRLRVDWDVLATHPKQVNRLTEEINRMFSPAAGVGQKSAEAGQGQAPADDASAGGASAGGAAARSSNPTPKLTDEQMEFFSRATAEFFAGGPPRLAPPRKPEPGTRGGGLTPDQAAKLIATGRGERASAVIAATQLLTPPPGTASGSQPADVTLDVTRGDGTCYRTVTRVYFETADHAGMAAPGTRLNVRLDPADPTWVAIESSAPS
jgi:hypothetical protein